MIHIVKIKEIHPYDAKINRKTLINSFGIVWGWHKSVEDGYEAGWFKKFISSKSEPSHYRHYFYAVKVKKII